MINKTIHYIWLGGNKKSRLIEKCIKSWRRHCPDYEIIEWNETNFDINSCRYLKQAYDNKKWAFASDYIRHYILNQYGGIYLDTDVELIRPIEDLLSIDGGFCGFESRERVASGLIFGCNPNNWLCEEMLKQYELDAFVQEDGAMNLCTVCDRATAILEKEGLKLDGTTQVIQGITVFATDYFNPINMQTGKVLKTKNTYSIHRYAASWVSKKARFRGKAYQVIARMMGVKFAEKLRKLIGRKK